MTLVQKAALQWYAELKQSNNDAFLPLFFDRHRYLVLMGGGGSGKSIFAGRKVLERAAVESGHRFLVVRKVARTLEQSCYRQLCTQAREYYSGSLRAVYKTPQRILFRNGSEIIFAGLDDAEKLKSIYGITGIWIEEASEITEADFNQLDIRLRDRTAHYKQIILSFNPISSVHWLKKRFFDKDDPQAKTSRTTYRDNRFLTPEAVRTLENFRETDEYFYMVYALGQWGVTGKTVFDARLVSQQLEAAPAPVKRGLFAFAYDGLRISDMQLVEDGAGAVCIYRDAEEGHPYVIGCDTAGEGSDRFCAQVLDNSTGRCVAVLTQKTDEDLFARQLYCLGKYFNDALIGIEVNFSSYPQRELERLGYKNFYVRETMDDYTHALRRAFGYRTDSKTRPVMIANLVKVFREDPAGVCDRETLEEMLTFVRDENLRPAAEAGAHDDRVMALAIAHMLRPQQSGTVRTGAAGRRWREDMWEDYRNADEAGKKYLIGIWGQPMK